MKKTEASPQKILALDYAFSQISNEKARRHFLALRAGELGYGGITAVAKSYGVSRGLIYRGKLEIASEGLFNKGRQRKRGWTSSLSENFFEEFISIV